MKSLFLSLNARLTGMPLCLWFYLLLITACQPLPAGVTTPTPAVEATVAQPLSPIPTPTLLKTATPTATSASTNTATPTASATATVTDIPTLTSTPVSTLPPETALAVMEDLLTYHVDCPLPCWWGAIPGQTSWDQVNTLITSLSTQIFKRDSGIYVTYLPHIPEGITGDPWGLEVYYKTKEGVIEAINVTGGHMPTYFLQPILANYGPPDEVWIQAMPYTPTGEVMFRIALLYFEQGFSAHILTRMTSLTDGQVVGCFSADAWQGTSLFLWIPGKYTAFPTIVREGRIGQEASSYLPLEEATGMDIVTFYNNYKEPERENCLSTPADIWQY